MFFLKCTAVYYFTNWRVFSINPISTKITQTECKVERTMIHYHHHDTFICQPWLELAEYLLSLIVEVVERMADEDEVEIGASVAIGLYSFLETAHLIFIHQEFYLIDI